MAIFNSKLLKYQRVGCHFSLICFCGYPWLFFPVGHLPLGNDEANTGALLPLGDLELIR
jgi:hypothetical protein